MAFLTVQAFLSSTLLLNKSVDLLLFILIQDIIIPELLYLILFFTYVMCFKLQELTEKCMLENWFIKCQHEFSEPPAVSYNFDILLMTMLFSFTDRKLHTWLARKNYGKRSERALSLNITTSLTIPTGWIWVTYM